MGTLDDLEVGDEKNYENIFDADFEASGFET